MPVRNTPSLFSRCIKQKHLFTLHTVNGCITQNVYILSTVNRQKTQIIHPLYTGYSKYMSAKHITQNIFFTNSFLRSIGAHCITQKFIFFIDPQVTEYHIQNIKIEFVPGRKFHKSVQFFLSAPSC